MFPSYISYVGGASAAATTITIPGTYQNGDMMVMYGFNNAAATAPTLPAGWMSLASNTANSVGHILAFKLAQSASETSGTWTNATGLVCQVYRGLSTLRGVATNKIGIGAVAQASGSSATLSYQVITQIMKSTGGSSWVLTFAGHATATNVATTPTNLLNRADGTSIAGFDSNGGIRAWPTTTVGVNASSGWLTASLELLSDQIGLNNYEFIKVGNGMSASERIR